MIKSIELRNFTAFRSLKAEFVPGLNIVIGENGTGKTHLIKAAYALTGGNRSEVPHDEFFQSRLLGVFKPKTRELYSLYHRNGVGPASIRMDMQGEENDGTYQVEFDARTKKNLRARAGANAYEVVKPAVFVPTKEVISFYRGFTTLYDQHGWEFGFDLTYRDICAQLDGMGIVEEHRDHRVNEVMRDIKSACGGEFLFRGSGVTFKPTGDKNEFPVNLMAEGFRKLGVLYRLLETQAIRPRFTEVLFLDEPETNMNPKLMELVANVLLTLSRNGQQVILATHDYVLVKWFEVLRQQGDAVRYHALYRTEAGVVQTSTADTYLQLEEKANPIFEAYGKLLDRELGL